MERCQNLATNQVRKADGIVLVFDLAERHTFTMIKDWLNKLWDIARENIPIILVGNKSDLDSEIVITPEEQIKLQTDLGIPGFRISALEGSHESIQECLHCIFDLAISFQEA